MTRGLVLASALCLVGCATSKQAQFQEAIRKAALAPVGDAHGVVPAVFRDLARAGGLDPATVYVALHRSDGLNAAAAGNHHFFVTRGVVEQKDQCLLWGVVAHEIAHDILKHPESIAKGADATTVVSAVLGAAAGTFVPGAGYLVQGAASLGLKAYSRSQEGEADTLAVKLLRDAGKPEWALRYALEILQRTPGGSGGGWLSTHPAIAERIAAQPLMDVEEVRRVCGSAPSDPPRWCRGPKDSYDPADGSCTTR